jgi:hypothetical protein
VISVMQLPVFIIDKFCLLTIPASEVGDYVDFDWSNSI